MLNLMENSLEDEMPPEEMWHHNERLQEFLDSVKERRANPDAYPIDDFDVPVEKNELLAEVLGDD